MQSFSMASARVACLMVLLLHFNDVASVDSLSSPDVPAQTAKGWCDAEDFDDFADCCKDV